MAKRPIKKSSSKKPRLTKNTSLIIRPKPHTNYKGAFDVKAKRGIPWLKLKAEFMADPDYMKPRQYLREVHSWTEARLESGYANTNLEGWGREKASMRQELLDESLAELRRTERERLPAVLKAKLNTIASMVKQGGDISKLGKLSLMDRTLLLRALKTELGEPTTVAQHQVDARIVSVEVPLEVAERLARDALKA
jgi:hypothetical protein